MVKHPNRNLEVLVFEERGKLEHPGKKLSEQRREPTTNSTHISMTPSPGIKPRVTVVEGECCYYCAVPALLNK